jgi:hypothetical protein
MHHFFGLTELVRDVPAQAETAACQSVKEQIEQDLTKDHLTLEHTLVRQTEA